MEDNSYILSLDVGTTTVRCHIFNSKAEIVGQCSDQVELLYPKTGYVEINPEKLWDTIVQVIKGAIQASKLLPGQITCMGICTQRCSFTHWNKETGKSLHNFITWKDIRANKIVKEWNDSLGMKGLRAASNCLYIFSRNKRFLAGSVLRIMNGQVTPRLYWALQNIPELATAVKQKTAMFGTVDTWLLYNLTKGKIHVTDASNASATGMFDPFQMGWANWALNMWRLPADILPEVVDTAGDFGYVDAEIFGAAIPIRCSMADQSASMFGSCCFDEGDLKLTLGTGSFMNLNTGRSATANTTGFYPVVAWKYGDELVYSFEGASNDTGVLIQWASDIGLLSNPTESAAIATSVKTNDGVYFIPAFSGFGPPVNDYKAASGFLGLKPTTRKPHMVRSILESIVFRVALLFEVLEEESLFLYSKIRVDGGVSKNDFICQLLADMTSVTVERPESTEMSVLGAAYFAGLHSGVWKSKEELIKLRKRDREFYPERKSRMYYKEVFENWRKVADRFKNWYKYEITEIDID